MFTFERATVSRHQARARVALMGPSGSGKTYTALQLAAGLGERTAVLDTERGSASKYAEDFNFSVLALDDFSPRTYVEAIKTAEEEGFDVLIIDSLSHAWNGKNGALELVEVAQRRYRGNTFAAWREVTPLHNALIDAILMSKCHIIATMRTKTEYVLQPDHLGKQVPVKVGLAPVQRDGIEYEFDIVATLDHNHTLRVTKTRCPHFDRLAIPNPDHQVGQAIRAWLSGDAAPDLSALTVSDQAPTPTRESMH